MILLTIEDITERKRMEEELEELKKEITQARLRTEELIMNEKIMADAQKIASIGSYNRDLKTNVVIWSDQLYRIFGFQPREISPTYETFLNLVYPEDRSLVKEAINLAMNGERPHKVEFRFIKKGGEVRLMYSEGQIIYDESGQPIRLIGISQDITERKQMEDKLQESEGKYATLVEGAKIGIVAIQDGPMTANDSWHLSCCLPKRARIFFPEGLLV